MMLFKCCTQYVNKFGKLSNGYRTGKRSVFMPIPKNGIAKEYSSYCCFYLFIYYCEYCCNNHGSENTILRTDFKIWGYITQNKITGSHGSSIGFVLKQFHSIFHADCSILHSQQQCTRVTLFPQSCRHLLPILNFIKLIQTDIIPHCGFYLHFPNDWWHWVSFHILVSYCVSSLEKCLFKSFACFKIRLLGFLFVCLFLLLNYSSSLFILDINHFPDIWFINNLSHWYVAFLLCWWFPLLCRSSLA